jgi:peptidoglycan hydrolase CwlO-like protein
MSELVNLEKRFENALEKLERALASNKMDKATENFNKKEEVNKDINHNIDDLLNKINRLEKAAENDAEEIDKLVRELEKVLETDND